VVLVPTTAGQLGIHIFLAADRRVLERIHDKVDIGPELLFVLLKLQVESLGPWWCWGRRWLSSVQKRRRYRGDGAGSRVDVVVERSAALVHVQVIVAVDLHALVMVMVMVMTTAELDHVGQQVKRPTDVPVGGHSAGAAVEVSQ